MLETRGEKDPLGLDADRVVESNDFVLGDLVALTTGGVTLADNTDATKRAVSWVAYAEPDEYLLISAPGIVYWPGHGKGSQGDMLWLGVTGGYSATEPVGSGVRVVQEVAQVWDDDHVLLFPPPAVLV